MEIEKLRELLNTMIELEIYEYNEILEVSRKLDDLIVNYYRTASV